MTEQFGSMDHLYPVTGQITRKCCLSDRIAADLQRMSFVFDAGTRLKLALFGRGDVTALTLSSLILRPIDSKQHLVPKPRHHRHCAHKFIQPIW